ncbi:MAG: FlgD immunoglobulin-like domain containing protein, partial [Calditrichia bacterium]
TTTIRFGLPAAGEVMVQIYSVTGQRVLSSRSEANSGGWFTYNWNGSTENGRTAASGVYIYRVQFSERDGKIWQKSGKMQLLK